MTIVYTASRILGLSSDAKPITVPTNFFFFETDTLTEFLFDGATWNAIGGGGSLSDLEFIESKVVAGDYFQVSGDINSLNDTIEFIVPNNKTAFLIEAKIVIPTHSTLAGGTNGVRRDQVAASLNIDGIVKDKTNIGVTSNSLLGSSASDMIMGGGSGAGTVGDGKFNVLGISLVGDGIKVIEIENILDNGTAFATMSGYFVDT